MSEKDVVEAIREASRKAKEYSERNYRVAEAIREHYGRDAPIRVLGRLLHRLPERMSCREGFDAAEDTPRTDFEEAWKDAYECWNAEGRRLARSDDGGDDG